VAFVVCIFGAFIDYAAFLSDPTPAGRPLQYIAIGVGTLLILAGLFAHYRWGGGDE
jgi:uncharacterized membrane protein YczE